MGSDERNARRLHTVAIARELARRRLPAPVFHYLDGAAGSERTAEENLAAFTRRPFNPRFLATVGTEPREIATTVLGTPVSMPILLGPVGFTRSMHPDGDAGGLAAAEALGTVFCHSTMSGQSIEELAHPASERYWYQLYFLGGRAGAEQLVERAERAGCATLMLTIDTPVPGNRERDLDYGASLPIRVNRRTVRTMARHVAVRPRWLAQTARDRFTLHLANAVGITRDGRALREDECLLYWVVEPPTWSDLDWLRAAWRGKLVVKGVLSPEDARRAVDAGCDAVVVSNHGGRQLDPCAATLDALGPIVAAVGERTEVLMDGGVRRGSDVAAALCLGARAVLLGRAWAYGLAAAGTAGARRATEVVRNDLIRTMQLLGARTLGDLTGERLVAGGAGGPDGSGG